MFKGKLKTFAEELIVTHTSTFKEEEYQGVRYRLGKPDAFKTEQDDAAQFPLIVYLHGAGSRGDDNIKQLRGLNHLGNGIDHKAKAFRKNHPCFVYVPQCPNGAVWEGRILATTVDTVEHLKAVYPIDPQRLYLIGYSMGGSGVYVLAAKYHGHTGRLFAGIIRLAGQSAFTNHVHETVSKTAVWLHVGLQDDPIRVRRARQAYAKLKMILGQLPGAGRDKQKQRTRVTHNLLDR